MAVDPVHCLHQLVDVLSHLQDSKVQRQERRTGSCVAVDDNVLIALSQARLFIEVMQSWQPLQHTLQHAIAVALAV
jgi:hypothetical protein